MKTSVAASLALFTLLAVPAMAAGVTLRSPQVAVSGSALATFFASRGQSFAVVGDQLDVQFASLEPATTIELRAAAGDASFGGYNATTAVPPLYQLFPGSAASGWFTVVSFRTSPTRLVVNLFDPNNAFQGTTTYLAGPPDRTAFGFYAGGAASTVYSQDTRNLNGLPRILAYHGTGVETGTMWFACELSDDPSGDFADLIVQMQITPAPVGIERTSWSRVKRIFR